MIRLNDINNFIEMSNFPSLNMAAKSLEVTQPALSASIKRLESDTGVTLFYRTKNGISLTPEGRAILIKSKMVKGLLSEITQGENTDTSILRLGCHPVIGSYFLPSFIKETNKVLPHSRFQICNDLSRNIQSNIQSGKVDLGIVVNPVKNPDLILKQIATDEVHIWSSKKKFNDTKLIADTDLFQVQSIIKKWKSGPKELITTSSLETIARMVDEGCGYGIIPKRTVELLGLNLKYLKNGPTFKDSFYIVYRPEFGKTLFEKKVLEILKSSFT